MVSLVSMFINEYIYTFIHCDFLFTRSLHNYGELVRNIVYVCNITNTQETVNTNKIQFVYIGIMSTNTDDKFLLLKHKNASHINISKTVKSNWFCKNR